LELPGAMASCQKAASDPDPLRRPPKMGTVEFDVWPVRRCGPHGAAWILENHILEEYITATVFLYIKRVAQKKSASEPEFRIAFLVYVQIVIYHYFTSGHDLCDVLWVVHLVLEDMREVKMLVVKLSWVIFNGLIFMLWCYSASGVIWTSTTWYFTFMSLLECIVYLATNCEVTGATET
jgi:hypothetical protein